MCDASHGHTFHVVVDASHGHTFHVVVDASQSTAVLVRVDPSPCTPFDVPVILRHFKHLAVLCSRHP